MPPLPVPMIRKKPHPAPAATKAKSKAVADASLAEGPVGSAMAIGRRHPSTIIIRLPAPRSKAARPATPPHVFPNDVPAAGEHVTTAVALQQTGTSVSKGIVAGSAPTGPTASSKGGGGGSAVMRQRLIENLERGGGGVAGCMAEGGRDRGEGVRGAAQVSSVPLLRHPVAAHDYSGLQHSDVNRLLPMLPPASHTSSTTRTRVPGDQQQHQAGYHMLAPHQNLPHRSGAAMTTGYSLQPQFPQSPHHVHSETFGSPLGSPHSLVSATAVAAGWTAPLLPPLSSPPQAGSPVLLLIQGSPVLGRGTPAGFW